MALWLMAIRSAYSALLCSKKSSHDLRLRVLIGVHGSAVTWYTHFSFEKVTHKFSTWEQPEVFKTGSHAAKFETKTRPSKHLQLTRNSFSRRYLPRQQLTNHNIEIPCKKVCTRLFKGPVNCVFTILTKYWNPSKWLISKYFSWEWSEIRFWKSTV